jgi:hypothetical protein
MMTHQMRNYWYVWYDLSYDSIRVTIRHIFFSVCDVHTLIVIFTRKSVISERNVRF